MDRVEWRDPVNGRLYEALQDGDSFMIVGPPEGLVDSLGLTEPFATTLHNVLYNRKLFTYKIVTSNHKVLFGALQEALNLDAQRLTEAFFNYEKEEVLP
jgi:hypothetical protein